MNLPSRPSGPFSSWEIGLALRYLRAKRKEGGVATIAVISFVGIMLAVAVLISVMSIMAGFRSELLGRTLSFNGHMYVQGPALTLQQEQDQLAQPIQIGAIDDGPASALRADQTGAGQHAQMRRHGVGRDRQLIGDLARRQPQGLVSNQQTERLHSSRLSEGRKSENCCR